MLRMVGAQLFRTALTQRTSNIFTTTTTTTTTNTPFLVHRVFMSSSSGKPRRQMSLKEQRARSITYLLRHGAKKENVPIREDGFVSINDILSWRKVSGITVEEIRQIVAECPKQRFLLVEEEGGIFLRANQGHTLEVEVEMKEIVDGSLYPVVCHGTYFRSWELIKAGGLSRMGRKHIHFSSKDFNDRTIISGMRRTSEILIYIDLQAAINDGFKFFISDNEVILTPGNKEGFLPTKYFSRAINVGNGEALPF